MALATRCPRCDATFRVVSDQLKLRGGLVRCGDCRHVFDAIGSLSYVEESALRITGDDPASGAALRRERTAEPAALTPAPVDDLARAPAPAASGSGPRDPLAVPTLVIPEAQELGRVRGDGDEALPGRDKDRPRQPRPDDGDAAAAAESPTPPAADIDTEAPVARGTQATVAESAPAFLNDSAQGRGLSIVYGIGALVLAVALTAQAALMLRTELLMRWPELRPYFVDACRHYGCEVAWPARADLVAVVGSELQQLPGTEMFELSAVLRNRAAYRIALPAVELTLTDPANRTLARKVFSASETLSAAGEPAARLDEGIAAGADHVIRITFEASGVSAASFVVYPFYP